MTDLTGNVGQLYQALSEVLADLNDLAYDFHRALCRAGKDLVGPEEYSCVLRRFGLPHDHTWLYAEGALPCQPTSAPALFAAVHVFFAELPGQRKPGHPGRPEIWFLLGRVQAQRLAAADVWAYFKADEARHFDAPLALGGAVSRYRYAGPDESWDTLCLGVELGEIDGPEALSRLVVAPLLAAAEQCRI